MFARPSFIFFEKPLCKISENNLLLSLRNLVIDRGSIDDIQFKDLLNTETDILKNSIMLSFTNIGIAVMIFFLINELFQEYMNFN